MLLALRLVSKAPEPVRPVMVTVPLTVSTVKSETEAAVSIRKALAELAEFWKVAAPVALKVATATLFASRLSPKPSVVPTLIGTPKLSPR